ncbi:MAG: hypothetical protein HQ475_14360 [SAR202 cluster bacterium]|nr:hypothetical protein [SAR202 cluster bacterium]
MITNWDGKRGLRPAPREIDLFESVNAHPSVPSESIGTGFHPAFEVMTLALTVTQTSAELHELIAKIATRLNDPSNDAPDCNNNRVTEEYVDSISRLDARLAHSSDGFRAAKNPMFQQYIDSLHGITQSIERAQGQFLQLESSNNAMAPAVMESFVGDCRKSLLMFDEVCTELVQLLETNPGSKEPRSIEPSFTDSSSMEPRSIEDAQRTLTELMTKLTPSVARVAQLPATAMAASAQCFAVAARDLQLRAGRFQGGFAGLY